MERALISTVKAFYGKDYDTRRAFDIYGRGVGMFDKVILPIISLDTGDLVLGEHISAYDLCEELDRLCPTFECEGLNAP